MRVMQEQNDMHEESIEEVINEILEVRRIYWQSQSPLQILFIPIAWLLSPISHIYNKVTNLFKVNYDCSYDYVFISLKEERRKDPLVRKMYERMRYQVNHIYMPKTAVIITLKSDKIA